MNVKRMMSRMLTVAIALVVIGGCNSEAVNSAMCTIWGGTYSYNSTYRDYECVFGATKSAVVAPGDALFISATAHQAGAAGTNWRSDLQIHNLGDEVGVFEIRLLEHGANNSAPEIIELSLAAGQSLRLGDVLSSEFGTDGAAALVLVPSSGRIIATSRTYNLLGPGNTFGLPAGATFGQYIPALPIGSAIRSGEEGRIIQLSHSNSTDGGARANLGLVNVTGAELRVKIELFDADGERLGVVNRTLEPLEYEQINRIYERVTGGDVDDGYAVLSTTTPGGAFFAYASVVDNLTGDPVAILAERLPEAAPSGTGGPIYVVAAAHASGAAGTNWRTDLEIHCWSDESAELTIEALEHGANNTSPMSRTFELDSGESLRLNDVLAEVFGFEGAAALRVTPSRGRVLVTSRTFNLLGEGNGLGLPSGATFGQFIQGVTDEQAIGWGEHGRLIQLAHSADDESGFRTNLVLVNAVAERIDVKVDLYESNGTFLGTVDRTLKPFEYRQLNRVFASVTGSSVEDGFAAVRTITEGGRFFALASVVDNLTGDPVGMAAPVILEQGSQEVLATVEDVMTVIGQASIEEAVEHAQDIGSGGLVDVVVSGIGENAMVTASGMTIDYGTSWTAPDGTVHSGSIDIDTSGLSIGSGGIAGTMTITHDGYLVDGGPPTIGETNWTFDLTERANGSVVGNIVIAPAGGVKKTGDLIGEIDIDTLICPWYPIGGFLRLEMDDEMLNINLSSSCHPAVGRTIEPKPSGGGGGDLLAVEWSFEGSTSMVGTIDSSTGEWNAIGSSGFPRLNCLARSAAGVYYSVTETGSCGLSRLITINPRTGLGTIVGEISGLTNEHYVSGLAFAPDGNLYASIGECVGAPVDELFRIDPGSGAASSVGEITGFDGIGTIDFDASGTLYGWNYPSGLMTINPASASGSDVSSSVGGPSITGLVVLPDGTMVGGKDNFYRIDPNTGETEQIAAGTMSNVRGIEVLE